MLVSNYVLGYKRFGEAILRISEESYECEKLDCGVYSDIV
jgi:hypothetical protein